MTLLRYGFTRDECGWYGMAFHPAHEGEKETEWDLKVGPLEKPDEVTKKLNDAVMEKGRFGAFWGHPELIQEWNLQPLYVPEVDIERLVTYDEANATEQLRAIDVALRRYFETEDWLMAKKGV